MHKAISKRRLQSPSILIIVAGLTLVACEPVPDNPTRQGAAGPELQLVPGRNCFQNVCFFYDSRRNRVSIPGKEGAPVPGSVNVADGYMTPAEFRTLHQTAALSPTITRD